MKIYVKEGRVTPKYKGYFISLWYKKYKDVKNYSKGVNVPYSVSDIDILIVSTIDGYIEVPKEYLIQNKILRDEISNIKGKLGFRIKEDDEILILKTKEEIIRKYNTISELVKN